MSLYACFPYFGFAYYIENKKKLIAAAVDGGNGGILPSSETVENGTYQPLSRPIFIYVNVKSAKKPEVREFIDFYMKKGPALVKEVQYFPLSKEAYALNLKHLDQKKTGTVFGGESKLGMKIGLTTTEYNNLRFKNSKLQWHKRHANKSLNISWGYKTNKLTKNKSLELTI